MHTSNERRTQNPAILSGGFFWSVEDARNWKRGNYSRGGKNTSKRKTLRTHRTGR